MSIWLKDVFLPIIIQLMGELFRTDGEQKLGLGIKISLLFNIMLLVVVGYLSTAYFELYRTAVERKADIATITHTKDKALGEVTELKAEIEKLETRLGTCETNAKVPSGSYNHAAPEATPRKNGKKSVVSDQDYDDDYVEALLRSING
tara:strand:- start:3894 stop:4337 length:444 start_codon:yes stop_codon:yes gene_type:complete